MTLVVVGEGTNARRMMAVLRVMLEIVAVVAGFVGIVMLVAPSSTDRYFSWPLGPPAAAALVGAFYVASGIVFGRAAIRETWTGTRGLCLGVLALTLPTLLSTARHRDVFDFSRWQAVAWLVLFVASPLAFGSVLWTQRRAATTEVGPRLLAWARGALVVLALAYGALALALWFVPGSVSDYGPFPVAGMGARFLGCWAAFLTTLAVYASARARWDEARTPLIALAAWPLGGLLAALVRADDLRQGLRTTAYLVGLALFAALAAGVLFAGRTERGPVAS